MKHHCLLPAIAIIATVAATTSVHAQTPALIPYQGRVQTGNPLEDFTGTGHFMFALEDQSPNLQRQATAQALRFGGLGQPPTLFLTSIQVTNGGAGYTSAPTVTISLPQTPGGVRATATATINSGGVTAINIVNAGTGYTADPTVTISAPPPTPPTIVWNNNGAGPGNPFNPVSLQVDKGLYSILLGDTSASVHMAAIPPAALTASDLRLRVWFRKGTDPNPLQPLTPDQRLAPNGYLAGFPTMQGSELRWAGQTPYIDFSSSRTADFDARLIYQPQGDALVVEAANFGIGTTDVSRAKLVVGGFLDSKAHPNPTYGFLGNGGAVANSAAVVNSNSIYGEWTIWAGGFIIASSDERIKNIQGRSNSATDLKSLLSIEVTDYHYKDTITKGAAPQKKVIAQQVEKVFPMAVSRQTDVVPDIFKKAPVKDGWISLKTDLKKGDRVRLTDDKTMAVHEVLEVKDDKFRTDFKPEGADVFVYGREVNDFRTVDYDAIAMLNVSATQELARKLDAKDAEVVALQKENAALKAELAAQASKDKAQDDQLAALSALLEKQSAAATTVTAGVSTVPAKR